LRDAWHRGQALNGVASWRIAWVEPAEGAAAGSSEL